jgi:ABC-type glycerol-3-phosphate transport system substrate-binding protein
MLARSIFTQANSHQSEEETMFRFVVSVAALVCVLALPAFAGAQSEEGSTAKQGKLTIWSTLTQESRASKFEEIAQQYESENPGVDVELVVMPWGGAFDKMVAAIMAGNPPDISTAGQGWPQSLAGTGGIVTLEDVVEKLGGEGIFLGKTLTVMGSLEGKMYSVPLYTTPHATYYRKSWIADAGKKPPQTWEELYDVMVAVTDPDKNRYGYAMPLGDIHAGKPIWGFLLSNGVTIFEKDNQGAWQLNINQPATVETYDYLFKLLKNASSPGVVSYKTKEINELIAEGVIMSRHSTPEVLNVVRQAAPDDLTDFGFVTMPPRKRLGSSQGWVGLVAYEKGNLELSKDFMQFMFGGGRLVDFYLSYPYAMFPTIASYYDNEKYAQGVPDELKPLVPIAAEVLENSSGIAMWNGDNPWSGEIENKAILGNALSEMIVSGISAQEAVDKLEAQIKRLMGE